MSFVSVEEAAIIMRFFRAHRTVERLGRKSKNSNLNKSETDDFIAAANEREALKPVVTRINKSAFSADGEHNSETEL